MTNKLRLIVTLLITAFLVQLPIQSVYATSDEEFVKYLEGSCQSGGYKDCYILGAQIQDGKGAPKDIDLAMSYYLKACEHNITGGCSGGAWLYSNGPKSLRNKEKGMVLYMRGCQLEGESDFSCKKATSVFGWKGVNKEKLIKLLRTNLYGFDDYGTNENDPEKFLRRVRHQIEKQACLMNIDRACSSFTLTEVYYSTTGTGNFDVAIDMAWRGCQSNGVNSCVMGTRMLTGFMSQLKKGSAEYLARVKRAEPFIQRGCTNPLVNCAFLNELKAKALQ